MTLLCAVFVLLGFGSLAAGHVVPSFQQACPEFFADPNGRVSPPTLLTGSQYQQICQTRDNQYEFATLYDTTNRIPVFSAYKYEGRAGCNPTKWYIEPQLDDQNQAANMADEASTRRTLPSLGERQALNADYVRSGYHKGHLVPVYHMDTQSCADATFTLTNAAPQNPAFNQGQWRVTEREVAIHLNTYCLPNSAYIVTGVVPGPGKINNRVNVPSHFWTAYCCLDNNRKLISSSAYLALNKNEKVQSMSVKDLEDELTELYDQTFKIFGFVEDDGESSGQAPEPIRNRNLRKRKYRMRVVE